MEERREILGSQLGRLIHFPNMSSLKLKKVLTCNDFDHELASKVVLDALFFKAETPHRQRTLAAEETSHKRFSKRAHILFKSHCRLLVQIAGNHLRDERVFSF